MDSATNACRQNPAYCASMAGEETVVPISPRVIRVVPPTTSNEQSEAPLQETPESDSSDTEETEDRVPSEEERNRRRDLCRDYYNRCIQARGGKPGRKYNETQCLACYDYCYRRGFWPARVNGKICRGT
ncbi:hypothetical protein F0U60_01620 [Archangium minus]|uniref:Lipoprotein n=1 Tax=Archangium minus TaxID=83450 RepID=A0ABY9WPN2_9BACT|nr:hypothetical protein F0U60_01620 [Archangium minus]